MLNVISMFRVEIVNYVRENTVRLLYLEAFRIDFVRSKQTPFQNFNGQLLRIPKFLHGRFILCRNS